MEIPETCKDCGEILEECWCKEAEAFIATDKLDSEEEDAG